MSPELGVGTSEAFRVQYPGYELTVSREPLPLAGFVAEGALLPPESVSDGYFCVVRDARGAIMFREGPFARADLASFCAEMIMAASLYSHPDSKVIWSCIVDRYLPESLAGWKCVRAGDHQIPEAFPGDSFFIEITKTGRARVVGCGRSWVEAFEEILELLPT